MEKKDFKILLVYPNIPLMTVPPLSMGIFTSILKKEGYQVELFDTTPYINEDDGRLSQKNRRVYLQYREYSDEDDSEIYQILQKQPKKGRKFLKPKLNSLVPGDVYRRENSNLTSQILNNAQAKLLKQLKSDEVKVAKKQKRVKKKVP